MEHATNERSRKMRVISETAGMARSILHKKVRQLRASAIQHLQPTTADKSKHKAASINSQHSTIDNSESSAADRNMPSVDSVKQTPSGTFCQKSSSHLSNKKMFSKCENHHLLILKILTKWVHLPIHLSGKPELPKVGDVVNVSSLGRKGTVLRVDPFKEEILVQAGNMKLKVKLIDVET